MTTENTTTRNPAAMRFMLIAGLVLASFFGAYQFAAARSGSDIAASGGVIDGAVQAIGNAADSAGGGAGCACCGSSAPTANGITGDPVEAAASVSGESQAIAVDVSTGTYAPNVIKLKAGVPAEITFGQGSGCTAQVMSQDLNFFEDLSAGPRVVSLPALEPGEYAFSCGMQMVFGKIVVE